MTIYDRNLNGCTMIITMNIFTNDLNTERYSQRLWHMPTVPAFGQRKQEYQEFKVIFGHIKNSRPVWASETLTLAKVNK